MKNKILAIALLIIGVGICFFGVKNFKSEQAKHDTYIETTAIVVGYEDCELDEGDIGSRYIAEYKIDRDTYQIKSNTCSNVTKGINSKVKIKYNPNNPSDAVFANDISRYILFPIGLVFVICAVIVFRKED